MGSKAAVTKKEREDFARVAQLLHGEVAEFFKPKENQAIQDFIVTAGKEPKE